MIPVLVVGVLVVAALLWVAQPLRSGARMDGGEDGADRERAQARKHSALVAIVDLEGERELGKLAEGDFDELRAQYEAEALDALRELDALQDSTIDDDELELEIAAMREQLKCPECGAVRMPGRDCERCGAA